VVLVKLSPYILASAALIIVLFTTVYLTRVHPGGERSGVFNTAAWQRMASPGELSQAHAFLEHNCAACHTAVRGPEASKCIACHATNESILSRQPTAFHADIGSCRECHLEHRGVTQQPTDMEHAALTRIWLRELENADLSTSSDEEASLRQPLITWLDQSNNTNRIQSLHHEITAQEAVLNCATCHDNQDPHNKLFGDDCAQCHSTDKWTIPEFRHPSPRSTECAQCHQAPPSHYMGHFHMVSMKVAGKPHADVSQCHLCHQTTSWNDIQGVGRYKHH
jgi:hypothetical protein